MISITTIIYLKKDMCLEMWEGYPKKSPSSAPKILIMTTNLYKEKRDSYWDEK